MSLGCTLNLISLSPSKGRSSKLSSSVPSPYNFGRFGRFKTLIELVIGDGVGGLGCWSEREEGGRGIRGEFDLDGGRLGKTADTGGRAFNREEEVGIVRRRATGLEEGVEGRVGGTRYSKPWARLVDCDLAREDAVVASYRLRGGARFDPEPEASGWFGSDRAGNDAFLARRRWVEAGEGLRPEWDF